MKKILTFWLTALMMISMTLPTAFAAGDAEASAEESE